MDNRTIPSFMAEITEAFSIEMLDEDRCRDFFLSRLHPDGVFCPNCKSGIVSERKQQSFWMGKRITCQECNQTFSVVTGTSLNGIGIEYRALYLLLFLVGHGVKASRFAKALEISTGAAYQWANKAKGKELISAASTEQREEFCLEP